MQDLGNSFSVALRTLAIVICTIFVLALSVAPGSRYNLVGGQNTQYVQAVTDAASTLPVLCAENEVVCTFTKPFVDTGRSINRFVRTSIYVFYTTWGNIHNLPTRILSWF